MIDLDDLDFIARRDSLDVLGVIERFADQCHDGWRIGRAARGLPEGAGVNSVVVLGMGGSGFAGDFVRSVVEDRLPVPIEIVKSYGPLQEWVGRNSLVIAVSYSGNTEETLAAFEEAHTRGARLVAVSSGGRLAEEASHFGAAHIRVPEGYQPRASLGYLALPVLASLVEVGLVPDPTLDVEETVAALSALVDRCHRKTARSENPAKGLAERIAFAIPVIYGGHGLGATAAYRFKCDLNEYAKIPAFCNALPEMDHNEIVGWEGVSEHDRFVLVALRDEGEHPRVSRRFDATAALVRGAFSDSIVVRSQGSSPLARLLHLVTLLQFTAVYVGLARDVDPGPVEVIESLKQQLAAGSQEGRK